jgi:hypothetical protein
MPAEQIETGCEPCGHLGLFMGRHTIAGAWRRIAQWLGGTSGRMTQTRASAGL